MTSVGYVLSSEQLPAPELVELAPAAEAAGFDMVWMSDHFHPWQDNQGHAGQAWITLAALTQRLKEIPMGTGVTCPTFRYEPAVVAQSFATLSQLYPGKIFLGIGSGEAVNEWPASGRWANYKERSERMAEAIVIIRELWRGDWIHYQGDYYQVTGAKLYDPPPQMIPMYVAAAGENSVHLAGLHGDGLITDGETAADSKIMQAYREGAAAGNKNVDQMPITVESWVFVGKRDDALPAAEKWRFTPKVWSKFVENPDPRDIQKTAEAEISLDEVMESWTISDDPKVHIDAIQKLADKGITNIFLHSAQSDQRAFIDFYGKQVLPNIQHERMDVTVKQTEVAR